jgi:hypothetical protein
LDLVLCWAVVLSNPPCTNAFPLEITEVNPDYDIDERMAKLAALITAYFIHEKFVHEKSIL